MGAPDGDWASMRGLRTRDVAPLVSSSSWLAMQRSQRAWLQSGSASRMGGSVMPSMIQCR